MGKIISVSDMKVGNRLWFGNYRAYQTNPSMGTLIEWIKISKDNLFMSRYVLEWMEAGIYLGGNIMDPVCTNDSDVYKFMSSDNPVSWYNEDANRNPRRPLIQKGLLSAFSEQELGAITDIRFPTEDDLSSSNKLEFFQRGAIRTRASYQLRNGRVMFHMGKKIGYNSFAPYFIDKEGILATISRTGFDINIARRDRMGGIRPIIEIANDMEVYRDTRDGEYVVNKDWMPTKTTYEVCTTEELDAFMFGDFGG